MYFEFVGAGGKYAEWRTGSRRSGLLSWPEAKTLFASSQVWPQRPVWPTGAGLTLLPLFSAMASRPGAPNGLGLHSDPAAPFCTCDRHFLLLWISCFALSFLYQCICPVQHLYLNHYNVSRFEDRYLGNISILAGDLSKVIRLLAAGRFCRLSVCQRRPRKSR